MHLSLSCCACAPGCCEPATSSAQWMQPPFGKLAGLQPLFAKLAGVQPLPIGLCICTQRALPVASQACGAAPDCWQLGLSRLLMKGKPPCWTHLLMVALLQGL